MSIAYSWDVCAWAHLLALRPVDVIFSDIKMPEEDGFVLLEYLRAQKSSIQVIMVSALHEDEDIRRAYLLGAFDYISKPFQAECLVRKFEIPLMCKQNQAKPKVIELPPPSGQEKHPISDAAVNTF